MTGGYLDSVISRVSHNDITLIIHSDSIRSGELPILSSLGPKKLKTEDIMQVYLTRLGFLTWALQKLALITSSRWLLKSVTIAWQ